MDKIDVIFIEKAVNIRKEYIKCIESVDLDMNKIQECKKTISELLDKGDSIIEAYNSQKVKGNENSQIQEVIDNIVYTIENLKKDIQPYKDRIKELEDESQKLYQAISDRYPNLSEDDMKNQIIPHLEK